MRTLTVLFASALLAACATVSDRPASVAAPTIVIDAPRTIFFGGGTTAPVTLDVSITNHATTPIRLRRIEISTPSMTTYRLETVRQTFDETILTGETKKFPVFTNAVTRVDSPSEPLSIRSVVTLEASGVEFREISLN